MQTTSCSCNEGASRRAEAPLTAFDDAARFFCALGENRCNWCSSPFRKVHRSGLCRHCYGIAAEKRRLAREVKEKWKQETKMPWKALDLSLRIECHVAGMMEESVRAEGGLLEHNRSAAHSGMTLEELLGCISNCLTHEKDLYDGCATIVTGLFSPAQREALIHLLYEAVEKHRAFNRRKRLKAVAGYRLVERSQRPPDWLKE